MSDDLSEYRELYLKTSKDLITSMRDYLNDLKKDPQDSTAITEFHRSAHSLKSQSLVMGYEQLGTVNRQLEAFFLRAKEEEIELNNEYLKMLETIVGHIEHALNDIYTSQNEPDLSEDINTLKQHTHITN